jgi:hydroxyacylglutathione hydrolase
MPSPEIELVPCLSDNYAVLVRLPGDDRAVLVDAPEAAPIRAALDRRGWRLGTILVTHHHRDHVAGIPELAGDGVAVIGPASEADRIPGLTRTVAGGDRIEVAGSPVDVIATPGHTLGHVAYHLPDAGLLFSGDTLFAMGCGRLFEGTAADMWGSLSRLAALPDDTAVYCGHEYTLSNARFAVGVDPGNSDLAARLAEVERLRAEGRPTVPTVLALEKRTNPFLRAGDPAVASGLGLTGAPAVEVFAEIRRRKDRA